jgi:hypothetical protein
LLRRIMKSQQNEAPRGCRAEGRNTARVWRSTRRLCECGRREQQWDDLPASVHFRGTNIAFKRVSGKSGRDELSLGMVVVGVCGVGCPVLVHCLVTHFCRCRVDSATVPSSAESLSASQCLPPCNPQTLTPYYKRTYHVALPQTRPKSPRRAASTALCPPAGRPSTPPDDQQHRQEFGESSTVGDCMVFTHQHRHECDIDRPAG